MKRSKIYCLFREPEYSPGKVEDDAEILRRTALELELRGFHPKLAAAREAARIKADEPVLILTMCQGPQTLAYLESISNSVPVVNSPRSISNCYRERMVDLLARPAGRFAPATVVDTATDRLDDQRLPVWVKRADVHAMQEGDVVHASSRSELAQALGRLRARGIKRAALQVHVEGTVVKFYGVAGGRFFRWHSTGGKVTCSTAELQRAAEEAAAALGLSVYGGDAVVSGSGCISLIDMNDWPSFSSCCGEAAREIATFVVDRWLRGETTSALRTGGVLK